MTPILHYKQQQKVPKDHSTYELHPFPTTYATNPTRPIIKPNHETSFGGRLIFMQIDAVNFTLLLCHPQRNYYLLYILAPLINLNAFTCPLTLIEL